MKLKNRFIKSISGATGIEYGLIGGLLSIAIISGVTLAGSGLGDNFSMVGSTFGSSDGGTSASQDTESNPGGTAFAAPTGTTPPTIPTFTTNLFTPNLNNQTNFIYNAPTTLSGAGSVTSTYQGGTLNTGSLLGGSPSGTYIPPNFVGPIQYP